MSARKDATPKDPDTDVIEVSQPSAHAGRNFVVTGPAHWAVYLVAQSATGVGQLCCEDGGEASDGDVAERKHQQRRQARPPLRGRKARKSAPEGRR